MTAKILILDDEESIRFSFQRFLVAEGHEVTTTETYAEALATMDNTHFDLILADIVLEDGYGINILHEVLRRHIKTRVIIMTAYPTTATVQNSFRLKAFDYLIKPLRQRGLIDAVNTAFLHLGNGMGDVSGRFSKALLSC